MRKINLTVNKIYLGLKEVRIHQLAKVQIILLSDLEIMPANPKCSLFHYINCTKNYKNTQTLTKIYSILKRIKTSAKQIVCHSFHVLFEKNPRNLSGRTDNRRTYTDQHYVPIWWEQKTLHLRTLASEIFIANWLNAGYFMGYLIFLIFFYWRPCSAWINSQFHLTVNTVKNNHKLLM